MILCGDVLDMLRNLNDKSVDCCVTSPPYFGLRDYGVAGQIGLEGTVDEYVQKLVDVFRDVRRVLRDDGTLWLNLGDSYYNYRPGKGQSMCKQTVSNTNQDLPIVCARRGNRQEGLKEKDLIGIPWRVAFALQADGWYLRQDIIWHKPNPIPESIKDRCTKSHEYIFLLSKSPKYYFDSDTIREDSVDPVGSANRYKSKFGGSKNEEMLRTEQVHTRPIGMREFDGKRNKRDVWTVATKPYKEAHFATFPTALIEPCVLAGCPVGGTVLDPFFGSGTTGLVAIQNARKYIGIEINPEYVALAEKRIKSSIICTNVQEGE